MSVATITRTNDSSNYRIEDTNLFLNETGDYVLTVKDLPEDEKPRERLLQLGARNLSLVELVAVILGVGTRKEEVLTMSRRIVKEYGDKALGKESDPSKLADSLHIPISKASQLVAALELGRRFHASKNGKPVFIRNANIAYEHLKGMAFSSKEQLRGLYLNSRRELIHEEVISVGSLTANIVHPREVFKPAIEHGAVALIIAHNHPSGDATPTSSDIEVTTQIKQAGTVLGIDLLDHLIIVHENYTSII